MDEKSLSKLQIRKGVLEVLDDSWSNRSGYLIRVSVRRKFNSVYPECSQEEIDEALDFLVRKKKVDKRKIAGDYRFGPL